MHKANRARKITGTGATDKTAVLGIRQRDGEIRAGVVPDATRRTLQGHIAGHVAPGAAIYTDKHSGYSGLEATYTHRTVDHAERYVDGRAHTNGLENFWSVLKRGLHGTYVSVEPFHLFRYLDERLFSYNLRELDDYGRFAAVLRAAAGRRLTYAELTARI